MKQLFCGTPLVCFLLLFASCITNAQSVSIAATEGGSVTFTPEGVVRTAPKLAQKVAPKGIQVTKVVAKPKQVAVADTLSYPFDDLTIDDARAIRNCLASVVYDENPNLIDVKALDDVRKFITTNKDSKNSTKKLSIIVSVSKLECIVGNNYSFGMYGQNEKQITESYNNAINRINFRKKAIAQAEDFEKKKKISNDNSVIRRYKDNNDQ